MAHFLQVAVLDRKPWWLPVLRESDQWGIRDAAAVWDPTKYVRSLCDNDLLNLYPMKLHSCTVKTEPEKEVFLNTHVHSSAGVNVTQCNVN